MDEMINIQEELEKILKKKRYQHTLGVRYMGCFLLRNRPFFEVLYYARLDEKVSIWA